MRSKYSAITLIAIILIAITACASAPAPLLLTPTPPTSAPTRPIPPTETLALASPTRVIPTKTSAPTKERVTFKSGDLTLVGYLYKPSGSGPFPGVIYNHGSGKDQGQRPDFDDIASIFVPAGYVLFAPVRRGQGGSQGEYIVDQVDQERKTKGGAAGEQLLVQLMESSQLDDQLAGQAYLKNLPYVDKNRLAVFGCSYGGIQTILAAERGAGYKAAVAMSPAAESWNGNKPLQARLVKAVSGINIPVFLLHPANDDSLEPGPTLAKEFQRLGKPYQLKIYPHVGTPEQQTHCFGGPSAGGGGIWGADVLAFLSNPLK